MAIDIIARGMIEESSSDVKQLSEKVNSHTGNGNIHVTTVDKSKWNGYDAEINQNKSDISALYEITSSGETVGGESSYTLKNAVDYPLIGLNLYGKSVQDGVPTPDNPVEIVSVGDGGSVAVQACGKNIFDYRLIPSKTNNGVTCTNNNDGTFTFSGSKTDISNFFLSCKTCSHEESINILKAGKYTLSSNIPQSSMLFAFINFYYNGTKMPDAANTAGDRRTFTVTEDMLAYDDFRLELGFYSPPNEDVITGTFNLQLEAGETATEFEPYKGTTANITSALPLCGIPVDSDGNYTDSTGQQWICDELVYNADGTGKIVKHTEKITYDDSYSIANFSILGNCARFYIYNRNKPYTTEKSTKSICDFIPYMSSSYNNDVPHHYMQYHAIWIFIPVAELSTQDITGVTEWLSEKQPTFVYRRATPQEIALTAAEMSALSQLQTYNGVTNISNGDDADMDVKFCTNKTLSEYVMPITTALQSQIDELKAAVLSLGGNV